VSPGERLLADPEARLQHARDLAWSALNRREHTVAEMRRVLERKRVDPGEVSAVVAELSGSGYLDDADYARRFAEDRRNLDGWGSERIERRLRSLGVERHLIDAAIGARAAEEEQDAALELLRRRFPEPPVDARERNRALGVLVRKGFELELALGALRRHCSIGEFD
jgi:regulatory protein